MVDANAAKLARYQQRTLVAVWLTYGAFYFGRANISPAIPFILDDLQVTKEQMGLVLGGTKLAYALGQVINGQIANRVSPRTMLKIGMGLSVALNLVFGFATGYTFMLFVWFLNGYAQSLGWTPCVKVMAHWFPGAMRGKAMGIVGTCYQITSALTLWGVGLLLVTFDSWRVAFWIPAAVFAAVMIYMWIELRDRPESVGLSPTGTVQAPSSERPPFSAAFRDPVIWLVGAILGAVNIVRYGFLDWAPTLLTEVQHAAIDSAALKTAVLPIGGAAGAVVSGWVSDRFFRSRRAPVVCTMLVALAGLTWLAEGIIVSGSTAATVVLFAAVGFMIYGPQVILVGTLPQDLCSKATAAGAAGLINGLGYIGAVCGDVVTGSLSHRVGWGAALAFWNVTAVVAALLMATQWNRRPRDEEGDA